MQQEIIRKHFDYASVYKNVKRFIDTHNDKQDQLTEKINANCRATAELIVRLYLKQMNGEPIMVNQDQQEPEYPPFRTFNESLAKCKGCTKRTVMNHKKKLLQSGFIQSISIAGANGLEIHLNPNLFQKADVSYKPQTEKNFHPLVHEQQEQNNINSNVDKSGVTPPSWDHGNGLDKSETTGTKKQEQDKNTEKNADFTPKPQAKLDLGVDRIFLKKLIADFWEFARKILYPNVILSEPEENEIKNQIWASVYGKFRATWNQKEWQAYHDTAIERIIMVKKWMDRNPTRWLPTPFWYFHPENEKNSFQQETIKWLLKTRIVQNEVRRYQTLQRIKVEQDNYEKGKGRHRHLSRIRLFELHKRRLEKMNDPEMLETYYSWLISSNTLSNNCYASK